MYKLNEAMKFLIEKKIQEDDNWKKIKIVFSGSDVPGMKINYIFKKLLFNFFLGEGEHKILDYIRKLKTLKDFDPVKKKIFYSFIN